MTPSDAAVRADNLRRYAQLAVLVFAASAIYPIIYLRQNFEVTILNAFAITPAQLGQCYALLGVIFVLTYAPSGWLADRVQPRLLMSFSLAATALLGIWFSTMPSFFVLKIIFAGWGIAAGLTFWSALIKAVAVLAKREEQGRFFGILDGGRGLIEAILATIAVGMFAYWLESLGQAPEVALRKVIWMYVGFMLFLSPIVLFALSDSERETGSGRSDVRPPGFLSDLKLVLSKVEIWLAAACILCGYQLFWATYSFSAYMQTNFGLTAVGVGAITVAKLWMRPIGAAAAGFAGDFLNREKVLAILLALSSLALSVLAFVPVTVATGLLLVVVMTIGLMTYAVRGIYWATLETCDVPDRIKGLAIGVISIIGYSPEIYLELVRGELLQHYPGKQGFGIYYCGIAVMGLFGAAAAWRLKMIASRRNA